MKNIIYVQRVNMSYDIDEYSRYTVYFTPSGCKLYCGEVLFIFFFIVLHSCLLLIVLMDLFHFAVTDHQTGIKATAGDCPQAFL